MPTVMATGSSGMVNSTTIGVPETSAQGSTTLATVTAPGWFSSRTVSRSISPFTRNPSANTWAVMITEITWT